MSEAIISKAKANLEVNKIYEPHQTNHYDRIVFLYDLPKLNKTPEQNKKDHKQLLKRIVEILIQPIVLEFKSKFSKDQLTLPEEGSYCVVRFLTSEEAKKFVQLFNGSTTIFGDKYPIKIQTYADIVKYKANEKPTKKQSEKGINLDDRYKYLLTEDVSSQFALLKKNSIEICDFHSSQGVKKETSLSIQATELQYTTKGTFIYVFQKNFDYCNLKFYINDNQPVFTIDFRQKYFRHFVTYQVSACENFITAYYKDTSSQPYKCLVEIYSLYEESLIFESEWFQLNNDLISEQQQDNITNQMQFNFHGTYFYLVNDSFIKIYEVVFADFFLIKQVHNLQMRNVRSLRWSPCLNYLAISQMNPKPDLPSTFTVIQPNLKTQCKVVDKSIFVKNIKLIWQNNGKQVSIIAETKQHTQIQSFQMTKDFPCSYTRFPPGSIISDFQYSSDSKYCVCLATQTIVKKKVIIEKGRQIPQPQPQHPLEQPAEKQAVYIQEVNSEDPPQKIISVDAEKLHFCPQTNVFIIVGNGVDCKTVSFVDAKEKCYLSTYEFNIKTFAFDVFGRYIAVLDKGEKHQNLNILDCAGQCQFVQQADDVIDFKWRPENNEILNTDDLENEFTTEQQYIQQFKERQLYLQQQINLEKQIRFNELKSKFNKIFCDEQSVDYAQQQSQQQEILIKQVLKEYKCDSCKISYLGIIKQNEIDKEVTKSDFEVIKELYKAEQ